MVLQDTARSSELLALTVRRDLDDVPGQPQALHRADDPAGRIELPPPQAVQRRTGEGVMVVVPGLPEGEEREPEDVRGVVVDREAPGAEERQTELIDQVMWCRRKIRTAPPQSAPVRGSATVPPIAQPRPNGSAMPEAGHRAAEAAAMPVRRVWIALPVGVGVVLAVVGDPGHDRALDRHGAEPREHVLDRLVGLEGAVREQPVEAERHAEACEHVHDREDREVAPVEPRVPEEHDRDEERDERDGHPHQVRELVRSGHARRRTRG
jgi:hypothetical protein